MSGKNKRENFFEKNWSKFIKVKLLKKKKKIASPPISCLLEKKEICIDSTVPEIDKILLNFLYQSRDRLKAYVIMFSCTI